jgi:cytochrome c556
MFHAFKFRLLLRLTVGPAVAALVATLLAGCGEVEDTRPGQPVKQRQTAFKEIVKTFEPMGVMLRKGRYEADKFLPLAEALLARRDGPWLHFGADTNYPPTKATPEVWKQPEEFAKDKQAFIAATDTLLAAAQSKDRAKVEKAYDAVHEACKTCHKQFKER